LPATFGTPQAFPCPTAFGDPAPVDLIIAKAGTSSGSSLDGELDAYDAAINQIEINLIGAMALVGPALPRLRGRGQGQIAVISLLAGLRGLPDSPAYSASKAGLIAWGKALRSAEATRGIGVTVIGPGLFESVMGNHFKGPAPFC
jgi:NAD(P)-dependent dehydrogenase (short-subunit alcohol dehydrogenase family)